MTPERRRQLLEASRLGRAVIFSDPAGAKGDLDPAGHWVTQQGQRIHITAGGEIDAGGHPELRKALVEKAGLTVKGESPATAALPPAPPEKPKKSKPAAGPRHRTVASEGGVSFKTGEPVTFRMVRNLQPAPKRPKGAPDQYQQGIEPAGRYMTHAVGWKPGDPQMPQHAYEEVTFKNPLVVPLNSGGPDARIYDDNSWKMNLSREFGGKKGQSLSNAIARAGHDGIVTVDKYGTSEIVDLRHLHPDQPKRA